MLALIHVERECARQGKRPESECFGWVLDGTAFIVRDKERLCGIWLPQFLGQQKFDSFIRKVYRWGFKKSGLVKQLGPDYRRDHVCFINPHFQRDKTELLKNMKSITAIKTRSELLSSLGLLPDDINRVAAARKEILPEESQSVDLDQKLSASARGLTHSALHSTLSPQVNPSTSLFSGLPAHVQQQRLNLSPDISLFQTSQGVATPGTHQSAPQEYPMAQNQIQPLLLAMAGQGRGLGMGHNAQRLWYPQQDPSQLGNEASLYGSTMVSNQIQLLLKAMPGQGQGSAVGPAIQQLANQSLSSAESQRSNEYLQTSLLQSVIQLLLQPVYEGGTSQSHSSQHQLSSISDSSGLPLRIRDPTPFYGGQDSISALQQIAQLTRLATQQQQQEQQQHAAQSLSPQRQVTSLQVGEASLANESNVQPIFALLQRLSRINPQQQRPPSNDHSSRHPT
jgi:HSF-type DNA-binding